MLGRLLYCLVLLFSVTNAWRVLVCKNVGLKNCEEVRGPNRDEEGCLNLQKYENDELSSMRGDRNAACSVYEDFNCEESLYDLHPGQELKVMHKTKNDEASSIACEVPPAKRRRAERGEMGRDVALEEDSLVFVNRTMV